MKEKDLTQLINNLLNNNYIILFALYLTLVFFICLFVLDKHLHYFAFLKSELRVA